MRTMYFLSMLWEKLRSFFSNSCGVEQNGVYKVIDRRGRVIYYDAKTRKFVKAPK